MSAVLQPKIAADRKSFYDKIDKSNVTPLWEVLHGIITPTPKHTLQTLSMEMGPGMAMDPGGRTVDNRQGGRAPRARARESRAAGRSSITHSLYAGLQLILPGETAPAHRHTQSALRFILLGQGAYTAVDGEKVTMGVGDFVITPSWTFHDHGNPSDEPMVGWRARRASGRAARCAVMEKGSQEVQQTHLDEGDQPGPVRNTMKPVEYKARSRTLAAVLVPYERTREALRTMSRGRDPHACWGHKAPIHQPGDGRWAMPTIGRRSCSSAEGIIAERTTLDHSNRVCAVEGSGRCRIGGETLAFGPRDVFVCRRGAYRLEADDQAVLFSFSDRPVQQALDLWREAF